VEHILAVPQIIEKIPEEASLDHLEAVRLQVGEEKEPHSTGFSGGPMDLRW
jgi:hypothetical protein